MKVYDNDDNEYEITATWIAGSPARMYLKNGDPGYPAEGGEFTDIEILDENGIDVTEELMNNSEALVNYWLDKYPTDEEGYHDDERME